MGGPHTFFHTEEVLEHFDVVAIGEGETIWPQMLRDEAAGSLERVYRCEYLSDLQTRALPKYELLDFRRFSVFKTFTNSDLAWLRWSALFPISICHNKLFLDLAQRSGLLHVNFGFESVSFEVLEQMNKK